MNKKNEDNLDSYGPSKDKKGCRGKRGVLSTGEMAYIKKNVAIKTINEIAISLSKSELTIRKYIFKKNLVTKETLENVPDAYRRAKIKTMLRNREYWPEIKQQFNLDELKMYEEHFVNLYLQFDEDVLASEELQIKKYITLEILKDRMLKQEYSNSHQVERTRKMLDVEYALPPEQKNIEGIRSLTNTLEKLQSNQLTFLKEYRDITEEQKYAEKSLKISRDDRIKNIQDATQNWTSILRLLNENSVIRNKVGKHIEIMKIAALKQEQELFNLHKYVNGDVDYPILNVESIGDKDE